MEIAVLDMAGARRGEARCEVRRGQEKKLQPRMNTNAHGYRPERFHAANGKTGFARVR
jgi:hypothetical protein